MNMTYNTHHYKRIKVLFIINLNKLQIKECIKMCNIYIYKNVKTAQKCSVFSVEINLKNLTKGKSR